MIRIATAALILMAVPHLPAAEQDATPVAGEPAPDFTMTTIDGKSVKLSEKLASGDTNVVLLFSRANW